MKRLSVLLVIAVLFALVGCTTVTPGHATSNPVGSKVGESTVTLIFGIPLGTFSDASIATAAKNGGIKKISTVDNKVYGLGYLYQVVTTVVTGE